MKTAIQIIDEMIEEQQYFIKQCDKYQSHEKGLHTYASGVLLSAKERIKNETGWISVEDRLPDNYMPVNIVYPKINYPDKKEVSTGFIDTDGVFYDSTIHEEEGYLVVHPTHWKPLPLPPHE